MKAPILLAALGVLALPAPAKALWFANCTEARAAGYSNIPRGQPGYAPKLDRDDDGIACESGRGRSSARTYRHSSDRSARTAGGF